MGILFVLIAVVAIAVFVWNFRRQAAAREAAAAERMKAFIEATRANPPPNPVTEADAAAAAPSAARTIAASDTPTQPAMTSGYALRTPLLSAEQRVMYLLLKSGLPECEVFACVSLAAFIQPAEGVTGFAREAQARRLADATADFLVCDKSMKAIAAVQCGVRTGKAAESAAFAAACAVAVGLRWVEISPQALPRREEVRQRVLGV